jgi:PAS domain S-box-containing protein
VVAGGVSLVLLVGFIDFLTPAAISYTPFYLVPILIVTWFVGRRAGVLFAVASTITWSTVELMQHLPKEPVLITWWNAMGRLGVFLVMVFLLHAIKTVNKGLESGVGKRAAELAAEIAERQRVEGLLRANEEIFRQLTAAIREVFWMTSPDKSQLIYLSPAYETIWGRTCESNYASPKSWVEAIHPEDRERVFKAAMTTQVDGQYDYEYRVVQPNGSIRWVHDRAFPVRDASGKVYRIAGLAQDITERKQTEAQLTTLGHAVESTSELICITDLQDRFVFVNQAFQRIHGYTEAEILGKTPEILYSPRNPPELLAEVLNQTRLGGWQGEVLDRRKDGTEFPIYLSTSLVKDGNGRVIGLLGVAQDITERKLAEARMTILAHAVESTSELICLADLHNHFTFANSAFQKAYGYTEAEILDQTPELILSPNNPPSLAAEILKQTRLGGWRGELLNRRKDGTEFPIYLTTSLLKDQAGRVIGFMGTAQDVTERKQFMEDQQRQQTELKVLFNLIPAMIWFKDAKNRILRLNKRAAELAGKSVEEIEGKSTVAIHPEEAAKFYADDLEVIRSGLPKLGIVEAMRNPEGRQLWVQTDKVPYCDQTGNAIGIVVVSQDITERKLAEARMTMLAHAVESTNELICITDLQDRLTFVNRAFQQTYGYAEHEILGKTPDILFSPKNPPTLAGQIMEQTHSGGWRGEVLDRRKDGTEFPISLSTSRIIDESGDVIGLIGVARDITERTRDREAQRRLEREILEISDREQARIGQDLHDGLCQQLVSTAFASNLLSQKLATIASSEAGTARQIAEWLDEAISQSRVLARGLYPVKLEADGLASALQELAEYVNDRFGIACVLENPEAVLLLDNAVATHLYRIAQEAVTNAVKHGKTSRILIKLTSEDGNISVWVQDDGVGIPDVMISGMGLHIMQYRTRMIGGTLKIERGSHGGTVVVC